MMSRTFIFILAAVAAALALSGCVVTTRLISETRHADGSVTKTEKSETAMLAAPVYAVPYGYRYGAEWDHVYGYRRYEGPRDRPCMGPFGQTINGVCYHTKPGWMR